MNRRRRRRDGARRLYTVRGPGVSSPEIRQLGQGSARQQQRGIAWHRPTVPDTCSVPAWVQHDPCLLMEGGKLEPSSTLSSGALPPLQRAHVVPRPLRQQRPELSVRVPRHRGGKHRGGQRRLGGAVRAGDLHDLAGVHAEQDQSAWAAGSVLVDDGAPRSFPLWGKGV